MRKLANGLAGSLARIGLPTEKAVTPRSKDARIFVMIFLGEWLPSFPRFAWERIAATFPRRRAKTPLSGHNAFAMHSIRDAERRGSAFPRGAWEREEYITNFRKRGLADRPCLMAFILRSIKEGHL